MQAVQHGQASAASEDGSPRYRRLILLHTTKSIGERRLLARMTAWDSMGKHGKAQPAKSDRAPAERPLIFALKH